MDVCTFPTLCTNTLGSFVCGCLDGYVSKGRKQEATCVGRWKLNVLIILIVLHFYDFAMD